MSPITRKAMVSDIPEIQRLYIQRDSHHADLLPEVFQFALIEDAVVDNTHRGRGVGLANGATI